MKATYPAGSENVGDELNRWLWPALLGDLPTDSTSGSALLGIGTLLNREFCTRLDGVSRINVLGTGAGYGSPPEQDARWHCYAVRGPRSAKAMGLSSEHAVADAAYLLATLDWSVWTSTARTGKTVVVPHHRSLRFLDWAAICEQAGLTFLSPLLSAESFMQELASADLVLAEAMHGAILADILRVPWVPFSFGGQFNAEKWYDWAEAFGVSLQVTELSGFYEAARFAGRKGLLHHCGQWLKAGLQRCGLGKRKWRAVTPPGWPFERAEKELVQALRGVSQLPGQLTGEQVFRQRVAQLYCCVNQLRRDYGGEDCKPLSGNPQAFFSRYGE
ncbi:polysaccharide pyruvyl transferase family protein [Pseudomonas sp.]|uniref:polysaccharide pyruvyl transferase family protein n=1 Tax=Pseudomonas sp. TaxID=306 RepID=UPI003C763C97